MRPNRQRLLDEFVPTENELTSLVDLRLAAMASQSYPCDDQKKSHEHLKSQTSFNRRGHRLKDVFFDVVAFKIHLRDGDAFHRRVGDQSFGQLCSFCPVAILPWLAHIPGEPVL